MNTIDKFIVKCSSFNRSSFHSVSIASHHCRLTHYGSKEVLGFVSDSLCFFLIFLFCCMISHTHSRRSVSRKCVWYIYVYKYKHKTNKMQSTVSHLSLSSAFTSILFSQVIRRSSVFVWCLYVSCTRFSIIFSFGHLFGAWFSQIKIFYVI